LLADRVALDESCRKLAVNVVVVPSNTVAGLALLVNTIHGLEVTLPETVSQPLDADCGP
jgi:hypothetical protein